MMRREEPTHTSEEHWLKDIDIRLAGAVYPMDMDTAWQKLNFEKIDGKDVTEYFDRMNWPVRSKRDFMEQLRRARESERTTMPMMAPAEMPTMDVREAMRERADALIENDPGLIVRYGLYSGDYGDMGVLTILDERERVIGIEFFETERSWMRPSAASDYRNASNQGNPVTVVLPHDSWQAFDNRMQGARGFAVYDYYSLGLKPWSSRLE